MCKPYVGLNAGCYSNTDAHHTGNDMQQRADDRYDRKNSRHTASVVLSWLEFLIDMKYRKNNAKYSSLLRLQRIVTYTAVNINVTHGRVKLTKSRKRSIT